MATKKIKRAALAKTQTFPSGNQGIIKAVKTAKQRGEPTITFKLPTSSRRNGA